MVGLVFLTFIISFMSLWWCFAFLFPVVSLRGDAVVRTPHRARLGLLGVMGSQLGVLGSWLSWLLGSNPQMGCKDMTIDSFSFSSCQVMVRE